MPIRKPKPTSPGRRFATYPDFAEVTAHGAREVPHRGPDEVRRAQQQGPQDLAPPRRRGQAPVPQDRLQAPQGRRAGQGRLDRVRPQPLRLHRAAALRRRREALHPRAAAPAGGRPVESGPGAEINVGQRAAARGHADRHGRPQRRARARPRRPARPRGGRRDPAHGEGAGHGHAAASLRRDADGARGLPRHRRRDRQRRPPERQDRQGRAQAPHGRAPADARHGDEPGGPPARRRRGLDHAGPPPGDPVGRAHARLPHAQEEQARPTATSSAAGAERGRSDEPIVARRARGSRSACSRASRP